MPAIAFVAAQRAHGTIGELLVYVGIVALVLAGLVIFAELKT